MNDFTKEELELIHDGLSYAAATSIETGGMIKDFLLPVAKKIQYMIENYCEHENSWADVYCDDCKKELCWEMPAKE
jgi:hypothetical protein